MSARTEALQCHRWRLALAGAALVIAGCSSRTPNCQNDPPFYLRGTKVDCATPTTPPTGGETK